MKKIMFLMPILSIKNPVATMTPNGAFIINGKYIIGKPQAEMADLVHPSQLRNQTIELTVPDAPRPYDENRDINDQDTTRTGLIRADIGAIKLNIDRLRLSAEVSELKKVFNQTTASDLEVRKLRNEVYGQRGAAPATNRARTIVDPLEDTTVDGNIPPDDTEEEDDEDAAKLAELQAKQAEKDRKKAEKAEKAAKAGK